MKRFALAASLFYLSTAGIWAEDKPPTFAGTWILDAKKSDPAPYPDTTPAAVSADKPLLGDYKSRQTGISSSVSPKKPNGIVRIVIEQVGDDEWKLSGVMRNEYNDIPITEILKCDGKVHEHTASVANSLVPVFPVANSIGNVEIKKSTEATLKKNKLQINQLLYRPQWSQWGNPTRVKSTLLLSKNGQILTLKTENFNERSIQTQVYHRQEP